MKKFTDFYEAYNYISNHKMTTYSVDGYEINCFYKCLNIEVVKVNPKNNTIENDDSLNTKTQVWLEFGGYDKEDGVPIHDWNLDCGGDTFEDAIIELANLVNKYYD